MAGPGVVKGGGCGRAPARSAEVFLLAVDILCMKKVFSLGQVHSSYQIFH